MPLATDQTAALATGTAATGLASDPPSDGRTNAAPQGPVLAGGVARGAIPPVPRDEALQGRRQARLRVRVPLSVEVPDATIALLEAAAPLVRTIREHAPELRALRESGKTFVKEADRILRAERRKKRAAARR